MLREKRGALFRLSTGQQLVDATMNRNQATRIIVSQIDENHTHPQFAQKFLVKGLQAAVPVKANQQRMKVQIEADGPHPINAFNRALIAFQGSAQLRYYI